MAQGRCDTVTAAAGPALCRPEEIADGTARGFVLGQRAARQEVLVHRHGQDLRAYVNACPHVGTPLDWQPDRFMSPDGRHLQCATHGALFRVEDGLCVAGPCRGRRLTPVAVRLVDGLVQLVEEGGEVSERW